jgi:FkbM family methyltransferase
MIYKVRKFLNKVLRGRLLKIQAYFNEVQMDELYGQAFYYYLKSDIGYNLFNKGEFEKKELALCERFINEDSNILDIGANIGIHSVYFSQIATKGNIISVEPQTHIYHVLIKNIENHHNITPINVAIFTEPKITSFFVAEDNAYSSLKDTQKKKILKKQNVITFPADYFKDIFPKIDFIKIDVEGLENDVVESMKELMIQHKPIMFIEIYKGDNSNPDPEKTIQTIIDIGYEAYYVDDGELKAYIEHNDLFPNHFFLPKK